VKFKKLGFSASLSLEDGIGSGKYLKRYNHYHKNIVRDEQKEKDLRRGKVFVTSFLHSFLECCVHDFASDS